jgi:hypothetical protein
MKQQYGSTRSDALHPKGLGGHGHLLDITLHASGCPIVLVGGQFDVLITNLRQAPVA